VAAGLLLIPTSAILAKLAKTKEFQALPLDSENRLTSALTSGTQEKSLLSFE
jgi:hypothetical protein